MKKCPRYQDALTMGYNEEQLKDIYEQEVMHKKDTYVFMCVNIKRFQYINDRYGRNKANEVIKCVYEELNKHLKEGEYLARIYGDHFNALLHYSSKEEVMEHFLVPFVDDFFENKHSLIYHNLYLSFGFYVIENSEIDFYQAQNYANITRTECIHNKNRTFSYEFFNQAIHEEYRRINEMADAVTKARYNGEFVAYVQPKIDLKSKQIIGGEVLLRWFDKEGREIPLSSFLPVLNTFGDIYLVDFNIFEMVCSFMHECFKQNKPMVPLSFNITNTSLFDENFIEDYSAVLQKYQIPEQMVQFEFMENIQYSNYDTVREIISKFRKAGFICALDDFGSGYSSFNILLNAQIDIVKLDRIFFIKALDEYNKDVIGNIINLCKRLNVKVTAEGIESKEYVDYLSEVGCDYVQGFYFYKPMPLDQFQKLLEQKQKEDRVL
ncbi:MAG: EAL domain-containing protein [Erysipelotrichia bacterium]|nr:EAL domain-containing protein [Erysipelotrichia bacterium]NCC55196.1 EAL domain-containing protein [Erysipelotrichia bacterium]